MGMVIRIIHYCKAKATTYKYEFQSQIDLLKKYKTNVYKLVIKLFIYIYLQLHLKLRCKADFHCLVIQIFRPPEQLKLHQPDLHIFQQS